MDIDGDGDYEEFLGMTSFTYFGAGSSISDPDLSSYAGSLQFYNLMEGFYLGLNILLRFHLLIQSLG